MSLFGSVKLVNFQPPRPPTSKDYLEATVVNNERNMSFVKGCILRKEHPSECLRRSSGIAGLTYDNKEVQGMTLVSTALLAFCV